MKWSRKLYQLRCAALVLSEFRDALKDQEVVKEFTAKHANELWKTNLTLHVVTYAKPGTPNRRLNCGQTERTRSLVAIGL